MDTLKGFTGATFCPKCLTAAVTAVFCEKDCSRGAGEKGGLYVSETPALGSAQPPEHLHRMCKGCHYEWLEGCADSPDAQADPRCSFCLRTRTMIAEAGAGGMMMQGQTGNICSDCADSVSKGIKQARSNIAQAQGVDPKPSKAAQAH